MTTLVTTLLRSARDHIERGWCQGTMARGADGVRREPTDQDAASWCAQGALDRASSALPDHDASVYWRARRLLRAGVPGGGTVPHYNDDEGRVRADILALYDRAIERSCTIEEDSAP